MKSIVLTDPIYGEFEISEPIIIELINSKPLQRLKKIGQHGLPPEYYLLPSFTRYDHSIGVFLLLRKLGASLKEQIAGLLHDVSHTAFSHVADFLYKRKDENYQDSILEEFILNSEIKQILEKYDLRVKDILETNNSFSLLEKIAPDICADRLDYTLREIFIVKNKEHAKFLFNSLIVKDNELIFLDFISAKLFFDYYAILQKEHWGSVDNMIRYELTADLLKYAANKNIISLTDLQEDDYFILNKLFSSDDAYIKKQLEIILKEIKYVFSEDDYDYYLNKKFRYVDPKFYDSKFGTIKKYSENNLEYLDYLTIEKAKHEKGYKVKLLS